MELYVLRNLCILFVVFVNFESTKGQVALFNQYIDRFKQVDIKWCTIGIEEYKKCIAFKNSVSRDKLSFGSDYVELNCVTGSSKDDCMRLIEEEKANIATLDAGEVFTAGRYYSLVPILQELYNGGLQNYFAVAILKKGTLTDVNHLRDLRGKKACFAGVGTLAGWVLPLSMLMKHGGLDVIDCNNHVKNAIKYFGPSCAVNSLQDKYNPIGDNSDKLCKICIGKIPGGKCTNADPYAGFTGAFRCLLEAGDIAFLKHTTVVELVNSKIDFPSVSKEDFELLCPDGSRRPIDDFSYCNWGYVPSHAVVTSSAKTVKTRRIYQKFLQKAVQLYGGKLDGKNVTEYNFNTQNKEYNPFNRDGNREGNYYDRDNTNKDNTNRDAYGREINTKEDNYNQYNPYSSTDHPQAELQNETFRLFESIPRYGNRHDLLFMDVTEGLVAIEEGRQTFTRYLGSSLDVIYSIRQCPINAMTLCVTSDPEMEKCHKMRTALKAQLLKPEVVCYKGHSHIHCMQAIRNGDADVSVLDAGDVYTAGLQYTLVPIMSEVYNLGVPEYFVVAVAKEEDPSTEITYLKGKNTCHGGVNTGAGWIVPMAFLLSNGWIRGYGCDSMRAAAEYFSKMCLPGAQSTEYNIGLPYDNMCQLCHGASYRYCHRDASEDYYGHTGAFRCLVEGGGDVAFVKHTTVTENTDGKKREWWARNTLNEDFQLLCPDGTRATMDRFRECNLGRVKANAIVTRGGDAYNLQEINAYINLFIYAQQFYGRKDQDEFNFAMFYSQPPYADLIFSDAATQLLVVPPAQRWYSDYLGKDFMRAKRIIDCNAGGSTLNVTHILVLAAAVTALLLAKGLPS